jgi:hypothetical protein
LTALITREPPATWQLLEQVVCEILTECGMSAQRQASLQLLRGAANVDVLATDVQNGITTRIVCECKYWESPVPQAVVHAFRSVLSETGAHRGYIISKIGFQSGAYEAAHATNIDLLTFEEFQQQFFERWLMARLETLEASVGALNTYYEPFGIPGMGLISDESEQEAYYQVWRRHLRLGLILPYFSPYMRRLGRPSPLPPLPMAAPSFGDETFPLPADLAAARGYREFLCLLQNYSMTALAELRACNPITRGRASEDIDHED